MRVISGSARGIKLKTIEEWTTRPTVDRVKENLFNIIQHDIFNATVLDLFSGSGSLCIECLSRGAKKAYFVEKNPKCITIIEENLKKTHLSDNAVIRNTDYENYLSKIVIEGLKFDIIFLDPPHKKGMGCIALEKIQNNRILTDNGLIVVEHHPEEDYEDKIGVLIKYKFKKYGNTALSFYKYEEDFE